jgi:hypothetical protein
MSTRILVFPTPRVSLFRRSGPLRWIAVLILLMISAGFGAMFMGSVGQRQRLPARHFPGRSAAGR